MKEHTTINPIVGRRVVINGKVNAQGVLEAGAMGRASAPEGWDPDSPE